MVLYFLLSQSNSGTTVKEIAYTSKFWWNIWKVKEKENWFFIQVRYKLTLDNLCIKKTDTCLGLCLYVYLCTTLCDKVCQWLATGWWFSPGTPVSSINKTDHHDITEILLEVVLNTINLKLNMRIFFLYWVKWCHILTLNNIVSDNLHLSRL
jgi:hypothetical protein